MSLTINHARIMDGFGELTEHKNYKEMRAKCGICLADFVLSEKAQKYILEERHVPVKMLRRGAAYCADCTKRRGRIRKLRSAMQDSSTPEQREALKQLIAEEEAITRSLDLDYKFVEWPY